jgi:hypothetical protein
MACGNVFEFCARGVPVFRLRIFGKTAWLFILPEQIDFIQGLLEGCCQLYSRKACSMPG